MEKLPGKKIVFASPWILITAVGLLLAIVLVFAVNNLQREQRLAEENLLRQGQGIIRMLEAGTRAANMRMGGRDTAHLQQLIEQAAAEPEIVYIALVNRQGTVVLHSDADRLENALPSSLPPVAETDSPPALFQRVHHEPQLDARIFEVGAFFTPFTGRGGRHGHERMEHRPRMRYPGSDPVVNEGSGELWQAAAAGELLILVGLDMSEAEKVISQNRRHIFFISLALLLVGIGGWLALLGAQGYRTAAGTLNYIQAFTGLLISRLPLGVIAVDRQGRIETCNEVAAEMCAVSPAEVIGRAATRALPELIASQLRQPQSEEEVIDREIHLAGAPAHGDDVRLTVMLSAVPIRDRAQQIVGRVVLLHDVTKLQAMEKEVQRHERLVALGKMAAGVAHEIRNPLSSIKGLATLLASRAGQNPPESETARLLVGEVERVNRSISELLDFARPQPLNRRPVDLPTLLGNSLQLVAADAQSLGVELKLQPPATEFPPVPVDADRLTQVLLNLYLNSLQAMPTGGRLEANLEYRPEQQVVRIKVSDTGQGIAPEILPRITDPYFTTKPEGSGLGLALVQKIIDDHGGKMEFTSQPDQGTTVTITLPIS
ncbi:two-component system sensor histidine kinase NtrB [Desulfurivibrio alkaliphilus]|uniref:histidine kinase n=1 Tax=Desulfurivibrio alkaliphilus (strain DSM 19089 / UNIQEM U267 / AHT2) TaxID=589865 RepID=D6Z162_DESAT|nr:ATP-binding protein [Desulfurivibrio alkaliphilus]ADH85317.1 signal transduction histidine kinase, nitrogen specific, NtrB [Desulfurivibrio alkaliphilus AHT 2]